MSDDVARLGVVFDAQGAEELLRRLKDVEQSSKTAEKATDNFSASIKANTGAIASSTASIDKNVQELLTLARAQGGASRATDQATKSVGAFRSVANQTEKAMRATNNAGLNLSRQLVDVGVSAQMGMNPLTILIQQGPQIADIFQQAAIQGQTFNGILRAMWMQISPLVAVLVPVLAVVGAIGVAFAISAHEINKNNKDIVSGLGLTAEQLERVKNKHVTMGDVAVGTWTATTKALAVIFKDQIATVTEFTSKAYNFLLERTKAVLTGMLGAFLGTFHAIKDTWAMLPAVMADVTLSAANMAIKGAERLVNGTIRLLNSLLDQVNGMAKSAGLPGLGNLKDVTFGGIKNEWAGSAEAAGKSAIDGFMKGWRSAPGVAAAMGDAIERESIAAAQRRIRKEAGKAPKGRSATGKGDSEYSDLYLDARYLELTSKAMGESMDLKTKSLNALIEQNTKSIEAYERQVAADRKRYDVLAEDGRRMAGSAVDTVLGQDPNADIKRKEAAYAEIDRLRQEDVLSEQQAADAKRQIDQVLWQARMGQASQFFGQFSGLQNSSNKKLAAIGKAAAIAQATIDGVLAVQRTLAVIPPPFNVPAAIAMGALTAVNIAKIAGVKGFETGGYTGNVGRKEVAGVVHGQEFVMNARATSRNRSALEAMNSGRAIPKAPNNDNGRTTSSVYSPTYSLGSGNLVTESVYRDFEAKIRASEQRAMKAMPRVMAKHNREKQ